MSRRQHETAETSLGGALPALLRLALAGLLALSLLLSLGDRLLLAELALSFRPQLAALAVAGALAALALRRRAEVVAALLIALLLAAPVVGAGLPRTLDGTVADAAATNPPPAAAPRRLTLVVANLLHTNRQPDRMADALLATDADVLVLLEVIPSWENAIRRLRSRYPHRTPDRWWHGTSTVVWSRHPLRQGPAELRRRAGGSLLDVTLEVEGRPLRLLALHAPRPRSAASLHRRNAIFGDLARWTGERAVPTVLAGDFNATPWTPALHRLVEDAGLLRSGPALGWYASWPAALGVLGIPIDQLLHDASVAVEAFEVFAIPGSDHRAIKVRLAVL